jgi:hypothetical protein
MLYAQNGHRWIRALGSMVAVGALLGACNNQGPAPTESAMLHSTHTHSAASRAPIGKDVNRQIKELRELTKSFREFEVARDAGWSTKITECFEDAKLGGMGFHYGNSAYIDGTPDRMKPELLLYEPRENGKLRLVAVEYIIPFTAWTSETPPQLYGRSFSRNEAFGIWALHVWHERENPRGVFADWNPKVSCARAAN